MLVVDLYSASRSASNALNVPLRRKKMSFQRRSEAVASRVPEWVWKRVPFHRTRSGKSPTTKRAATMSWNHQLATVGRSKAMTAWDVGCTRAAVHQVLGIGNTFENYPPTFFRSTAIFSRANTTRWPDAQHIQYAKYVNSYTDVISESNHQLSTPSRAEFSWRKAVKASVQCRPKLLHTAQST